MSFRINPPTKIYVDKSPIHGWGVFASEDIIEGEIIEEVPVLTLPINKGEVSGILLDYRFNWPQGVEWEEQVVGLGFASLYNHSDTANAYWVSDSDKKTFKFISNRNISAGEEIFIWYGDVSYWNDGRDHINVIP
jgi:SET domain-containing protein